MSWTRERFERYAERPVAVGAAGAVTYAEFAQRIDRWDADLRRWGVCAGDRVGLVADHDVDVVALLQALLDRGCIVVPLSGDDRASVPRRLETACASKLITIGTPRDGAPAPIECRTLRSADAPLHELLRPMVSAGAPGFVIFTSGSTGKEKAVLFDHARLTRSYREKLREPFRTLLFYKFDHIGGLDTLFHVILNGGTIVTCPSRKAKDVCETIERHRVELLPATPSFLTMLLMSGVHRQHDLSSLKVISYGTEVMPGPTLAGLHRTFPGVLLKQTYGLSELGVLATKSRESSSKWMRIGGQGLELKVRDGTLWVKSAQAMLGYLNAPNPFDADGWYDTGDRVLVDGEYFQILGRESEIINVAGEKVFPSELEDYLLTLDNVRDVVVRGKNSPIVGQLIWAEFLLDAPEEPVAFKKRVVERCRRDLAPFKVPGFITIAGGDRLVGARFKKIRSAAPPEAAAAS